MSARPGLSAVIITLNAERHLERVLAAVAFCDEIVVLDSGSSDRTLEILRAHQATIHTQAFLGFGRQKQRAVELARNDWVLVVDADEVLDESARQAIAQLDLSDGTRAWRLRRRSFVAEREVRHGVWSPDRSLRLFHRGHARFNDVPVHESVIASGEVLDLPGSLAHYSYRDFADVFARMGSYSRAKAGLYRSRNRRCGPLRLMLRMAWGFLRSYIFKLGILDGNAGVVVALSLAVDSVVAMAMASEPAEAAPEIPAAAGSAP
jgi:glycosyltransferase involved in cell wall biosynthesis